MNRYANLARERHRLARPIQHGLLEDPGGFFEQIGQELEAEVATVQAQLLGPQASGESPEVYRRRREQCLAMAQELTLAEHFLFQSETPDTEDDITAEELAEDPVLAQHVAELALIDEAIAAFYRPDEP